MERLYLKELRDILKYRDLRSVHRWCFNNHVRVLFDAGCKWRYVLREDFEKALNRMKEETGKQITRRRKSNHGNYTPQGNYEKGFLSVLTNFL
jgi:hypothetical protein